MAWPYGGCTISENLWRSPGLPAPLSMVAGLIVLRPHLKVALEMEAYRAYLGGLLADDQVAAVPALPQGLASLLKDGFHLHIVEQLAIAPVSYTHLGLIGPNGAGKTTVFNLLTNVYHPTRGSILLDGKDTAGKKTYQLNKMGIARTFQNIRLFKNLTVEDNVKIGLHNATDYSLAQSILRLPVFWQEEKKAHEKALELLSIFDMQDMADWKAGSLPYGCLLYTSRCV